MGSCVSTGSTRPARLNLQKLLPYAVALLLGLAALDQIGDYFGDDARQKAAAQLAAARAIADIAVIQSERAFDVAENAVGEASRQAARAETAEKAAARSDARTKALQAAYDSLGAEPDTCQPFIINLKAQVTEQTQRGDSLQVAVDTLKAAKLTLMQATDSLMKANKALREATRSLDSAAESVEEAGKQGFFKRLLPDVYVGVDAGWDVLNRQPAIIVGVGIGYPVGGRR